MALYKVLLIRVDLPEPDTPVTHTNKPTGKLKVTFFRLLPEAPSITNQRLFFGFVRLSGNAIINFPERYLPVSESKSF